MGTPKIPQANSSVYRSRDEPIVYGRNFQGYYAVFVAFEILEILVVV
jgi:hypothetical protein